MTFEAAAGIQQPMRSGGTYDGKIAGLYDLGETLGSGHFAVVKQARHVFTGTKVAVKVVDKTKLDEVSKSHLFQEVRCMKLVQHPNVVRLYEVIDTQTKLYLVLELGDGGDLYDYIMKHEGGLSQNLARKYFRQILRAITYCHKLHVVHRDLKPENVVFFEKLGLVKLTDFGFSNKFLPGQKLETFCGSLAYSAPEILLGDSYDAPAVDIWSLGVILYMLVCGQPPFEKANDSETLTMIMDCKYTVPSRIANGCRELIASMLVRDPKKRASLEEIAADPWLSENSENDISDFVPLVSRQEIIEEDHTFIVQKMINGNIASKDEIQKSLDTNKYDHITATYFLLAEMKLRKRQEEHNAEFNIKNESSKPVPDNRVHEVDGNMIPVNLNVCPPNINEPKMPLRSRKCSIVREEEEDESACENGSNANELKALMRRESISDGRINQTIQENVSTNAVVPSLVVPRLSRKELTIDVVAENDTAVMEKDVKRHIGRSVPVHDALKGLKDMEIGKFKSILGNNKNTVLSHRRTKLNKARTPSCSSSEASDDDTKVRNRKKLNKFVGDTPTRFRMHRRDSYDDSSDSQDQAFPPADSNTGSIITNTNNSTDKTKCQNQSKEQKKDDNQKSSNTNTKKNKRQSKDHYRTTSYSVSSLRRHSQGESLSLDRINEAQECEIRHFTPISSAETNINILNYRTNPMTKGKLLNSSVVSESIVHIRQTLAVVTVEESTSNSSDLVCIKEKPQHEVYNLKLIHEIHDKVFSDETKQAKSMEDNAKLNYMANFLHVVNCS